jgi:hypothetical protein
MARYYTSFMLWGVEGKQLNRNVGLADMSERFRMLSNGDVPLGIERYTGVSSASLEAGTESEEIQ